MEIGFWMMPSPPSSHLCLARLAASMSLHVQKIKEFLAFIIKKSGILGLIMRDHGGICTQMKKIRSREGAGRRKISSDY